VCPYFDTTRLSSQISDDENVNNIPDNIDLFSIYSTVNDTVILTF